MRHATHFLTITTIIIAAVMLSACTANTGTESNAPAIATVGGAEFDTVVLASSQPVVVDFYADWCGPCKVQAPILASVGQEFADQVHTLKVDIDADPELAQRYGIESIPTLGLFVNGEVKSLEVGLHQAPQLRALYQSLLATP